MRRRLIPGMAVIGLVVGLGWFVTDWVTGELGWWNDAVPFTQMPTGLPGDRTELLRELRQHQLLHERGI